MDISLVCACGHKENEHGMIACHECECVHYKSIGIVEDRYESPRLDSSSKILEYPLEGSNEEKN